VATSPASTRATAIGGRRARKGRMQPPSSPGAEFYSREQQAEIMGEIRYPKETVGPGPEERGVGCALPCTCAIDTLPSAAFVAITNANQGTSGP
jgi:hypothetical protein